MRHLVALSVMFVALLDVTSATSCVATLERWARLPAQTFATPPQNASSEFTISGKFSGGENRRNETLGAFPSCPGANPKICNDVKLPLRGQPIQGFSGVRTLRDANGNPNGTFLLLTDNGFGSKKNSPDALLMFHIVKADFANRMLDVLRTTFLSDPNKRVPFPIVDEFSRDRFLTGADFDPESIQPVGNEYWIGEEFGPWLINVDAQGRVLGVYETPLPGAPKGFVKSPDHDSLRLPDPDGRLPEYTLKRSRGFEGMAVDPKGRFLYPLLEGPIYNVTNKTYETRNGLEFLRIYKFDLAKRSYTNETFKYQLEINGNAIGDFNMIDECQGMIIERDNGEGSPSLACPPNVTEKCYVSPAKLKRIYLINLCKIDKDGFVEKTSYIDLLNIRDPNNVSPFTRNGTFEMPFQTIEDVDVYDAKEQTIVVANDNNFPYSNARQPNKPDDNELVILKVPGFFGGACQPPTSG